VRALVDSDHHQDPVAAAARAVAGGADDVLVLGASNGVLDTASLRALRALKRVRLRVSVATFDHATHARLVGIGDPGTIVRGIARAGTLGLRVEVVLPIAEGLGPVAGRLHGLARATPRVSRYLLSRLPEALPPLEPSAIAAEVESASCAAHQLGLCVEEDSDGRLDTELHAVLAGIKPAMRVSTVDDDEDQVRSRYEHYGLATCAGSGTVVGDEGRPRPLRLIYVARSLDAAEQVRVVEAEALASTTRHQRAVRFRDVGLALGYPPCCVDAYVNLAIASPAAPREPCSEEFRTAVAAYDASPLWQLNHLLLESGALATFMPCSYRCAAALDYATRVLAIVDAAVPVAAARLRRRLATAMALDEDGGRALLAFKDGAIVSARTPRAPSGEYTNPRDAELVKRLIAGADASARERDDRAPIVLRFDQTA